MKKAKKIGKVALLWGGWSAEREVSFVSGKAVKDGLEMLGYDICCIDPDPNIGKFIDQLKKSKADVIFNALHGSPGEDGTLQAVMDLLKIPYTHSGMLASAAAMDKPFALDIFRSHNIPVAKGMVVDKQDVLRGDPLPRPYVLKPAAEGSSIGIYIIKDGTNNLENILSNWSYGKILAEEYIPGRELTVSVMDDGMGGAQALGVTELVASLEFYNFEAKYTDGKTTHIAPADLPFALSEECKSYAVRAHHALGCRGVSRSDFRYDDANGRLVILEVNTQPGMTPLSLLPEQALLNGMSFEKLCEWMLQHARYG